MKLATAEHAVVSPSKIVDYLLSPTHRAGKSKAVFFSAYGFSANRWEDMAAALRRHASENSVVEQERTEFGIRVVVDGPMLAPDGSILNVRSVWYIVHGVNVPRFVTAHPLRREVP